MTPEEIRAELRECLALQTELETRRDELTARFKAIVDGYKGRIIVELGGEIYELTRRESYEGEEDIESTRKFRGFYAGYRLVKIGKPI